MKKLNNNHLNFNSNFLKKKGLTLIEVILAISLFSVVLLVITSGFYVGSRSWRIGLGQSNRAYKIYLGLDKLSSLIKNGVYFKQGDFYCEDIGLKFEAKNDSFKFFQLAELEGENTGPFNEILISKEEDDLIIVKKTFKQIIDEEDGVKQKIIADIKELSFEYAFINPDTEDIEWAQEWVDEANLPQMVRIIVQYQAEEEMVSAQKDVFIPTIKAGEASPD